MQPKEEAGGADDSICKVLTGTSGSRCEASLPPSHSATLWDAVSGAVSAEGGERTKLAESGGAGEGLVGQAEEMPELQLVPEEAGGLVAYAASDDDDDEDDLVSPQLTHPPTSTERKKREEQGFSTSKDEQNDEESVFS